MPNISKRKLLIKEIEQMIFFKVALKEVSNDEILISAMETEIEELLNLKVLKFGFRITF